MDFDAMQSGSLPPRERRVQWLVLWSVLCGLAGLVSLAVSDARPGQVAIWMAQNKSPDEIAEKFEFTPADEQLAQTFLQ